MNYDNQAILKSFEGLIEECHDTRPEPIRPIESASVPLTSEVPLLLPAVEDENLRPLLLSWYYAGYYTGRYQLMQEQKSNKN
jgi:hypothetical protein